MNQQETATKLASDHWGYIDKVLNTHAVSKREIENIGFHYRTAMIHGFKHGVEWESDRAEKESFMERVIEDAVHELSKAKDLSSSSNLRERILDAKQAKPSLCHSCHIPKCDKPLIERCEMEGVCAQYVPEAKQEAPTADEQTAPHTDPSTNCRDCGNTLCVGIGRNLTCDQGCERFEPKGEPVEWLDLTLPSITIPCTGSDILNKLAEEIEEYECAEQGSMAELIEAWDCIQVAQTFDEHGGGVRPHIISKISRNLADWHKEGRPVLRAKRAMIIKNAARAMYSIEDTADILATL